MFCNFNSYKTRLFRIFSTNQTDSDFPESVLMPFLARQPLLWEYCPPSSFSSLKMSFLNCGEIEQCFWVEKLKNWLVEIFMQFEIQFLNFSILQSFSILFLCDYRKSLYLCTQEIVLNDREPAPQTLAFPFVRYIALRKSF